MSEISRLCFIVTSGTTAQNFLRGYLSQLRMSGWSVTLICSDTIGLEGFANSEGVDLRTLNMKRNPTPLDDLIKLVHMVRLVRKIRPHVAVYATPKGSLFGALATRLNRVPVRIYEQWGLRLEVETGVRRAVLSGVERLICLFSTHIVANSSSLAGRINQLSLNGGREIRVLGHGSSHGVDLAQFSVEGAVPALDVSAEHFLEPTSGFTIGFVGRLHMDKGIDVVIEAVNMCRKRGVDVRCIFVGADEGFDLQSHPDFDPESMHKVGRVADTRPYYRALDSLVLMSAREGFPNVVLEAAAMGVPSIVSNGTGAIDSVIDGETGFVVPVGDARQLCKAIIRMVDDPQRVARMGRAARRRVEREFEQHSVRQKHINFFGSAWSDFCNRQKDRG